ncbi:MAG: hypothetical protein J6V09_07070 [Clostridia bacterium]|nr:hypothetical protein [Clostridia bacterium]
MRPVTQDLRPPLLDSGRRLGSDIRLRPPASAHTVPDSLGVLCATTVFVKVFIVIMTFTREIII